MENLSNLFSNYGYIVLFAGLLIELIGFPTPGGLLMGYCGYLIYQGKMNFIYSALVASIGVSIGITIAYRIGFKLGYPFFYKYGHYFHLNKGKLDTISKWFDKLGRLLIMIGYFIPGIRHITGYFSGVTRISFKHFAVCAYTGAILWTSVSISIGMILGPKWSTFHKSMNKFGIAIGLILFILVLLFLIIKYYRNQILNKTVALMKNTLHIFHSFGRMKLAILLLAFTFVGLFAYMIGLIQDFLGNEFTQFDSIADYLVKSIFPKEWSGVMQLFLNSTSYLMITIILFLSIVWITLKGFNKFLEIRYLFFCILGGEILVMLLQLLFHRTGPNFTNIIGYSKYTFPSSEALMATVTYGFFAYIISRHESRFLIKTLIVVFSIIVSLFSGISVIFFEVQYPSDVLAGYTFGGIWLCLSILLLEVYRILSSIKNKV